MCWDAVTGKKGCLILVPRLHSPVWDVTGSGCGGCQLCTFGDHDAKLFTQLNTSHVRSLLPLGSARHGLILCHTVFKRYVQLTGMFSDRGRYLPHNRQPMCLSMLSPQALRRILEVACVFQVRVLRPPATTTNTSLSRHLGLGCFFSHHWTSAQSGPEQCTDSLLHTTPLLSLFLQRFSIALGVWFIRVHAFPAHTCVSL